MPRPCSICNLEEIRLALDEKIRASIPLAEIAREYITYNLSVDSLERHARNHVRKPKTDTDPVALLRGVIEQTAELISSCKATSDVRGALDGVNAQLRAATTLLEHERAQKAEAKEKDDSERPWTMSDFDDLIANVTENYEECPHCHHSTIPRMTNLDSEKLNPRLPN